MKTDQLIFSSPVATAEFFKFAGIMSVALWRLKDEVNIYSAIKEISRALKRLQFYMCYILCKPT